VTRPWFLRRLAGDARRHAVVWLALAGAFALVGFCAGGARLALADLAAARAPAPTHDPARVLVYLKDDLGERERAELLEVLRKLPDVERATLVPPMEGLSRLRRELGERAALLEGVEPDLLFTSIEVTAQPAAASSLAFRLRRLRGVADVDLVPSAASVRPPPPSALARARAELTAAGPLLSAGGLAVVALLAALAMLRARLRPEVGLLVTLGVTRATGARPTLTLATSAGALGGAAGVVAASLAARAWLGAAGLPARELGIGCAALVLVAFVAAVGAVSGREVSAASS
jgi:hypothetical protein